MQIYVIYCTILDTIPCIIYWCVIYMYHSTITLKLSVMVKYTCTFNHSMSFPCTGSCVHQLVCRSILGVIFICVFTLSLPVTLLYVFICVMIGSGHGSDGGSGRLMTSTLSEEGGDSMFTSPSTRRPKITMKLQVPSELLPENAEGASGVSQSECT